MSACHVPENASRLNKLVEARVFWAADFGGCTAIDAATCHVSHMRTKALNQWDLSSTLEAKVLQSQGKTIRWSILTNYQNAFRFTPCEMSLSIASGRSTRNDLLLGQRLVPSEVRSGRKLRRETTYAYYSYITSVAQNMFWSLIS